MAIKELFNDARPQVLFNLRSSQRVDPRFKFTRFTSGWYLDSDGIYKEANQNQPRFEYDGNGNEAGLLIEPTRKNQLLYSVDTGTGWTTNGYTKEFNYAIAPDGTQTATRVKPPSGLVDPGGSSYAMRTYRPLVDPADLGIGTTLTFSVFVKPIIKTSTYINPPDTTQATRDVYLFLQTQGGGPEGWFNTNTLQTSSNGGYSYVGNGWYRFWITGITTISDSTNDCFISMTNRSSTGTFDPYPDGNEEFYIWGAQVETGENVSSYIPTTGATVSRTADLLSIDSGLPSTGSIYIDAQLSGGTPINTTLLSAAPASPSTNKLALAIRQPASLYNSKALVYEVNGAFKPTLPFPVPTSARERNLITYGANNYHYRSNSARYTPSSSTSVPANMTRLGIGHDVTDPTKAMTGYINAVYVWPGEIVPTVAEALVRGELNAINADAYVPTGPAGSLSFIINTQGAGSDGNSVFTLPASRATIAATALVVGETYRILSVGTTNFTLVGASANTVGTVFVATGVGTGTGTVAWQNDLVITWGDGTESGLEGAAAEGSAVGLTKTYSQAGIFSVWVSGRMQDLIFNNGTHAADLVRITTWGTGKMLVNPSTMANAFYGCSKLQSIPSTNLPDTSAVTSWSSAFRNCSSLTGTFPSFNTTAATTFANAWENCSALTGFPLLSTSNVTSFVNTWYGCSGLTTFPQIVTSSATTMNETWRGCTGLTSFPLLTTNNVTSMTRAWYQCSGLTSFPELNTAAVTSFFNTWLGCSSLTSFPTINTASATTMQAAWGGCSGLTTFPLLNTASVTDISSAWSGCSALTSFPLINTGNVTTMANAWNGCSALTSFPLINTPKVTNISTAWQNCSSLTSFPALNLSLCTDIKSAWRSCSGLTSFPSINFPVNTNASYTWEGCTDLTSFPSITLGPVTGTVSDVQQTGFLSTWANCTNLSSFPSGMFNTVTATRFTNAFSACALTAASIENILVSINTANTSNGSLGLNGGTNAGAATWTANAVTAYNALIARGWTITRNA